MSLFTAFEPIRRGNRVRAVRSFEPSVCTLDSRVEQARLATGKGTCCTSYQTFAASFDLALFKFKKACRRARRHIFSIYGFPRPSTIQKIFDSNFTICESTEKEETQEETQHQKKDDSLWRKGLVLSNVPNTCTLPT